MTKNKRNNMEYKKRAVKLAKEIGQSKAALELGIPRGHWDEMELRGII